MEVDEKPTEDYSDIGGLDKQIQELVRLRSAALTALCTSHTQPGAAAGAAGAARCALPCPS